MDVIVMVIVVAALVCWVDDLFGNEIKKKGKRNVKGEKVHLPTNWTKYPYTFEIIRFSVVTRKTVSPDQQKLIKK